MVFSPRDGFPDDSPTLPNHPPPPSESVCHLHTIFAHTQKTS
jgi:hypothetical protein